MSGERRSGHLDSAEEDGWIQYGFSILNVSINCDDAV